MTPDLGEDEPDRKVDLLLREVEGAFAVRRLMTVEPSRFGEPLRISVERVLEERREFAELARDELGSEDPPAREDAREADRRETTRPLTVRASEEIPTPLLLAPPARLPVFRLPTSAFRRTAERVKAIPRRPCLFARVLSPRSRWSMYGVMRGVPRPLSKIFDLGSTPLAPLRFPPHRRLRPGPSPQAMRRPEPWRSRSPHLEFLKSRGERLPSHS